mgnify:CR=1 FL=1
MHSKFNTIEEAIDELKKGNFVIVVDDEDRENEGDLIIAAEMITTAKVNFMEKYDRGLFCVRMSRDEGEKFKLPMMVEENTSLHETPFTVSVDLKGKGCTTGISVYDRMQTILALAQESTKPTDLARPGHVFPLKAQDNGVLARDGHTEAVVDLVRLAGFKPVGVLIEIKQADGSMARYDDLKEFAHQYRLAIVTIKSLISYRTAHR